MPSEIRKAKAMALNALETDGEKRSGTETNAFTDLQKTPAETEILRSLNNGIVKIRDKRDILTFIHPRLKLLFNTDDIFICFLDTVNATLKPVLRVGGPTRVKHPDYETVVNSSFPVHDGFIGSVLMSSVPLVFDIESLNSLPNPTDSMKLYKDTGLAEAISVSLHNANETIGVLTLFSETRNFFTIHHKELLAEIANYVSLVVVNILANEEIANREEEKSALLSLSYKIAVVRNKNELLDLLNLKLIELFPIKGFGITLLNENGETHSPFVVDVQDEIRNIEFEKVITQKYSFYDGVFNNIINAGNPVQLQVGNLAAMAEAPAYVYFWEKMGIHEVVGIPIRIGETTLGCFILLLDGDQRSDINNTLLEAVSGQISVAISNILANEEIANREKEKTILLSLSGEIASLKKRNDLFQVVNARIKNLFGITQFGIAQINEDKITHSAFIMDLGHHVNEEIDFKKITSVKYSITDTAFNSIVLSEDPVILDVDELSKETNAPLYVKFWREVGFKRLLCLALCVGGEPIGVIFFNIRPDEKNNLKTNLLKGICAQLAVAVSNILAHEKLIEQLHEINNYKQKLEDEKIYLKEEIEHSHNYNEIIGESAEIKKVFKMVTQVAYSDSTVLLLGETGTGKELIARAIHNSSTRKNKLMIKINCAALPANLIESELFGHERGSFTGASERRIGKFELANNGTLFLDEIGEMPLDLQVKLLRALQEKEIERVGGKTTIKTDVRIIAATNRNLDKLMEEGKFRSDLYYRLNIFPITLPSLKDRREDIPQLASYFIVRYSKKAGKKIKTINNKVLQELIQYDWPGNIRELEHLIERSVLLATSDTIKEIHLPEQKRNFTDTDKGELIIKTIHENEKEHILKILKHVNGKIGGMGGAAELLGIPTSTLNSRIKRLGIRREHLG